MYEPQRLPKSSRMHSHVSISCWNGLPVGRDIGSRDASIAAPRAAMYTGSEANISTFFTMGLTARKTAFCKDGSPPHSPLTMIVRLGGLRSHPNATSTMLATDFETAF